MADLRDVLQRVGPKAPEFDDGELLRAVGRKQRRRVTLTLGAITMAVAVVIGVAWSTRSDDQSIAVAPSSTTPPGSSARSGPSRATVEPVQAGEMPAEAFVAVGRSLVAIDTHDPANWRELTTFRKDAGIGWVTVDLSHGRVFFGVTSGCDPGINGTYVMPVGGGSRRRIAPAGDRAAISPDGTRIAFSEQTDGCGSRNLVVQDVASGHRQTFSGNRSISVGGWSADGRSVFLWAYDASTPSIYRFRPFAVGAQLDNSERWDHGVAADSGGGRVAIMDWCSAEPPSGVCAVGVRTRGDRPAGPDYSFGRETDAIQLSIDSSGQWPLMVSGDPAHPIVSFFAGGKWHELAPGSAADW